MFYIRFRKLRNRKSDHLELPSYKRATKWGLHWQLICFTYSTVYWIYRYFYAISQNMHTSELRSAWGIGSKHWKITFIQSRSHFVISHSVYENFSMLYFPIVLGELLKLQENAHLKFSREFVIQKIQNKDLLS